jgi:CspA family cold shock protein
MRGTVEAFDDEVGLGTVLALDGTRYPFHCTQISDGTRTIKPGVTVEFDVVAGHRGQWEAARLRRC